MKKTNVIILGHFWPMKNCFHQFFSLFDISGPAVDQTIEFEIEFCKFWCKTHFSGTKTAPFSIFSLQFEWTKKKGRKMARLIENWARTYSFGPRKMSFTSKSAEFNFKFNRLVYGGPRNFELRKNGQKWFATTSQRLVSRLSSGQNADTLEDAKISGRKH